MWGAILAGISGLSGLLGNRGSTSTSKWTNNSTTTSTPSYDTQAGNLRDSIINNYMSNMGNILNPQSNYWNNIENAGVGNIATVATASRGTMDNLLSSRGIHGAAAGSALTQVENNKQNAIANYLQQLSSQKQTAANQALSSAGSFMSSLPYSTTQTQTGSGTGSQTTPGNMLGGLTGGIGGALAQWLGNRTSNSSNVLQQYGIY